MLGTLTPTPLLITVTTACLRLLLATTMRRCVCRSHVPSFVPLDGDGFVSWLTKQDQLKAGALTPATQQKYSKEIRAAKSEEFKSYLDNMTPSGSRTADS